MERRRRTFRLPECSSPLTWTILEKSVSVRGVSVLETEGARSSSLRSAGEVSLVEDMIARWEQRGKDIQKMGGEGKPFE